MCIVYVYFIKDCSHVTEILLNGRTDFNGFVCIWMAPWMV